MTDNEILIEILEKSLEKNGDKPLTVRHLLNIAKLVEKIQEENSSKSDIFYEFGGR